MERERIAIFEGVGLLPAGALGGLVLWYAAFPSLYYLAWLLVVPTLWAVSLLAPVAIALLRVGAARLRGRRLLLETRGQRLLVGWLGLVTLLVAFGAPLRLHFALARDSLEARRAHHADPPEAPGARPPSRWAGAFYVDRVEPGRCDEGRIFFWLDNDVESALVYAPEGIDGLCYNRGRTGRLWGGWYWMTED